MRDRLPLLVIVLTVMLDAMGIGLILPVMPELIEGLTGAGIATAAAWGGVLSFAYAAAQVLTGPLLGTLSDQFGRRPVLLLSLVAMAVDYVILGFAGNLALLFVARILSGVTGATYATAYACIADLSPPERRSADFGLVGAAFGVGFILGPLLGGLLGELGPRAPFFAAAGLAAANALLGLFVLRETLAPENRRPFSLARANPLTALSRVARLPALRGLVAVFFLFTVGQTVYAVIWSYFATAQFGWGAGRIGLSLAVVGLCMALVQGWFIRLILPRLGEMRTARLGLVLNAGMMVAMPFIMSEWLVFATMPIMALGVIVTPAIQGMMSARTGPAGQGELQGVIASAQGIASILSPLLMTQTFRIFTEPGAPVHLPGAPFLVGAALMGAALVMLARAGGAPISAPPPLSPRRRS